MQSFTYTFTELKSLEQALKTFKQFTKGYVVWDKSVRSSLYVAFTVAGLERCVVVSEDLIPMMEKAGVKKVEDFRGRFVGQTDAQINRWAYDTYGSRCNNDYVVWLGGESGRIMKPGVADFAIAKRAFVTDLSTLPSDTIEYRLADEIFRKQKPFSMVMGWHSYAKDKERDYVRLASHYALRVEGLHTLPNLSFTSMTPPSPGFIFKNNHNVIDGKEYKPEKKVYVTCIQSDGLGLGAWEKPGRGSIPYAWEVTINWLWMCPTMLESTSLTHTTKGCRMLSASSMAMFLLIRFRRERGGRLFHTIIIFPKHVPRRTPLLISRNSHPSTRSVHTSCLSTSASGVIS